MAKLGRKKFWTLTATVPANTQDFVIEKTLGDSILFQCEELGGMFETLALVNGDITDTQVCPFRIQMQDAGTNYYFTDAYVPADLLLSKGRRKSAKAVNVTTAPADNPLYRFIDFSHDFTNKIECRVSNDSDVAQQIWVVFVGYEKQDLSGR